MSEGKKTKGPAAKYAESMSKLRRRPFSQDGIKRINELTKKIEEKEKEQLPDWQKEQITKASPTLPEKE